MTEKPHNPTAPLKAAGVLAGLFALLTLMVVAGTPLDAIDQRIADMLRLRHRQHRVEPHVWVGLVIVLVVMVLRFMFVAGLLVV
jgi:hypothetical protein